MRGLFYGLAGLDLRLATAVASAAESIVLEGFGLFGDLAGDQARPHRRRHGAIAGR